MKKYLRIILIIVAAGIIIGGLALLYVFRHSKTGGITAKPDFELTVTNLFNNYSKDEIASNKKFLGKILQVDGLVDAISNDSTGITVTFFCDSLGMNGVICALGDDQTKKVKDFKKGSKIALKGQCDGFNSDVRINRCSIIEK